MNISKREAQESLNEIESVISQIRRDIAHGNNSYLLIMWGFIWMIGFSGTQFFPKQAGWFWLVLDLIAGMASWMIMRKSAHQRPNGRRVGLAWLILFGYILLWAALIHPDGVKGMAFFSTLPMCGYVICGLWLGRFWIWLGLIVTALTLLGLFLLPAWFALWLAITGGGSLIISGLFIRKFWR